MEETCYEMNLPRENIHLRCFAHSIMNYRYHWHTDKYELNIVLHGTQEYCRGTETHSLSEDDLILTAPGNGHASMRQQPGTRALVLHFPSNALKFLVKKGYIYQFLITLFTEFDPQQINLISEEDKRRATIRLLLSYVEEHYAEKLSLEDLADYAQYNRTYVSTLFKQMVGINFHEYLTRVRFQHALNDLTYTNENLTDIALKNGFPDLKTLTSRFRSTFHRTPAQYRAMLKPDEVLYANVRKYLNPNDTILREKLKEYAKTGLIQ